MQVRFTDAEDGTIHYPGKGPNFIDDDKLWRHRAMMNAGDRYPKMAPPSPAPSPYAAANSRQYSANQAPPPPYVAGDYSISRFSAVQATEDDTQENPLYGASVDFIY